VSNGIYDARGRLIQTTVEKVEAPQMPFTSDITEGGRLVDNLAGDNFSVGNFFGNIVVRDTDGSKTIEILREGTIIMYDKTHPRALIGKQIGGF
jgi:hypothetical protein